MTVRRIEIRECALSVSCLTCFRFRPRFLQIFMWTQKKTKYRWSFVMCILYLHVHWISLKYDPADDWHDETKDQNTICVGLDSMHCSLCETDGDSMNFCVVSTQTTRSETSHECLINSWKSCFDYRQRPAAAWRAANLNLFRTFS